LQQRHVRQHNLPCDTSPAVTALLIWRKLLLVSFEIGYTIAAGSAASSSTDLIQKVRCLQGHTTSGLSGVCRVTQLQV
jgi:hypothetical protein